MNWHIDPEENARFVVEYVCDFYTDLGYGPTREDLAEALAWKQTRNLPGVRRAIAEGLIRYDESGHRLIPVGAA